MHTYLIYPILMRLLAVRYSNNTEIYKTDDELPEVSIIMAVRNSEDIIEKKINSVFACEYPIHKLKFYIGSDASTDSTDEIIKKSAIKFPSLEFKRFNNRVGKVHIINQLANISQSEILIFTDAYAIFEKDSIFKLIRHFKNPQIHLVGGRMLNSKKTSEDISFMETSYFEQEYKVKQAEGMIWGTMMGAFGSFYAVRKENWCAVPDNFIGDDFYISIKAISKGGKAIFEPEALVFENVQGIMKEEFRRKSRIATGNFQNLSALYPILFSKRIGLAFSFFSHKVLRWLGPVFIILSIISLSLLFYENLTYTILFIIMLLSLVAVIIDFFLKKIQIHIVLLRFISHFFYMNIALLNGMFRYFKGVKSNVWEPTRRK
jgi:cellulose synthase/poly-beta-1,6-N-acetylglucosamine synthase-like glycosyltransferase